ncbi:hypothetical protein I7I51_01691 [Histoplasma capsulatum]|uniref:Uncharacterized protein n=1 Tax=Ajellomyces capsulatus TaxID=5037 RepID=A0A8A1MJ75_AJECA|nr:hypothetical protein I7I51_01691 [Histoplasma capsulatum]
MPSHIKMVGTTRARLPIPQPTWGMDMYDIDDCWNRQFAPVCHPLWFLEYSLSQIMRGNPYLDAQPPCAVASYIKRRNGFAYWWLSCECIAWSDDEQNKTGNEKSNKRWNLTRNAEPEREAFPPHPGMSSYCESNNLALAYIDSYFDSSSVPFYFPFVSAFLEISLAKAEKGLKVRLPVGRNSLVLRQFHQASP